MQPRAFPFVGRIYLFINRQQSSIFAKQQNVIDVTRLGRGMDRTD